MRTAAIRWSSHAGKIPLLVRTSIVVVHDRSPNHGVFPYDQLWKLN